MRSVALGERRSCSSSSRCSLPRRTHRFSRRRSSIAFRSIPAAIAVDEGKARPAAATTVAQSANNIPTFTRWLVDLVPANPIKAAADGALLPLIIFTLLFGLALLTLPAERRAPVVAFFQGLGDAALTVVRWVLQLAPIGVFALALPLATRMGASAAGALAAFVATSSSSPCRSAW